MGMAMSEARFKYLEDAVKDIKKIVHEVHHAIVGSPHLDNSGIAKRLINAEEKLDELEEKIIENDKKQIKFNVYVILMWAFAGSIFGLIVAYIFQIILNTS